MSAFQAITAVAAPIEGLNVDTDQIIPSRFLKFERASGYGQFLFHDVRFDADDRELPEYVLNREPFRAAKILVADENFGCGSSREGAVYALHDFGIRVVIAPRFGDIFYSNSLRNGLVPAVVPAAFATELRRQLNLADDPTVTVDLSTMTVSFGTSLSSAFTLDPFSRDCLLEGVDEIGLALQQAEKVAAFERDYLRSRPWLA
jgi:3-isopropylmalate/(R)-2-methylmalate dehydratase small subunit